MGKVEGKWRIFAKTVNYRERDHHKKVSLEVTQQLMIVAKETGFRDWHWPNWVWEEGTKRFVCLDTGENSFISDVVGAFCELEENWGRHMEPEAVQWFELEKAKISSSQLAHFSGYYDSQFDSEQVLHELKKYRCSKKDTK